MIITISLSIRFGISVVLLIAFAYAARHHVYRLGKRAVCEVVFLSSEEETIQIKTGDQKTRHGKITHAFVSALICVFVVTCAKQRYSVMATPKCLSCGEHRKLRVWLNCTTMLDDSAKTHWHQNFKRVYDKTCDFLSRNP